MCTSENTTPLTRRLDEKTVSIDHLMIATMQRIQPLLGLGINRARVANEVSASLKELGLNRCSIWRFETDIAQPLYVFDRNGSAAVNTPPQPLRREEAEWLFRCAEEAKIMKTVDAGRVLCAIPVSSTPGEKKPVCLLLVEQGPDSRMTIDQHADDTLQFMSNVLCTIFCYACE
jgi:hypothetical protein